MFATLHLLAESNKMMRMMQTVQRVRAVIL